MLSHSQPRIAVVEDDLIMGESLIQRLTLEGYRTEWWQTGREAVEGLRQSRPDLTVFDLRLPDISGEDVFRAVLPQLRSSPVLFITGYSDIDQAVRLIRAGADDYMAKPFPMEEFLGRIEHLLKQNRPPTDSGAPRLGVSGSMRQIEALLRRVANINSSLLITGESGVGKEVAARFLHEISERAKAPFMAVNCAAIPATLLESELFGHERGAFTGAHSRHEGYAERTRDGILFLDEISELSPDVQAKLLRLIQDRSFFRVGGEKPVPFRARLICATNAELSRLMAVGEFREDLFYRINVIPVAIPPLRLRREDILPLLHHYLGQLVPTLGTSVRGFTTSAELLGQAHEWPGNVRELRNRVERAVALAAGPWIGAADLFPDLEIGGRDAQEIAPLADVRDAAERRHIVAALEKTGGQVRRAAELLGVSRTTLWEKMKKLGVLGATNS